MRPVRVGDRGAAVEDIQRRLRMLGYELGITGIDGVFFGLTAEAVRAFQQEHGLAEDGLVGDETWSALVDATFTLGDRMLYLRLPYFHGHDVALLQEALNALGFTCGSVDRIFGPFTEHAVREFQRNSGLPPDGIAGEETLRAIIALRHVWEGKDSRAHSAARTAPVRACEGLSRARLAWATRRAMRCARVRSDNFCCKASTSEESGASARASAMSDSASCRRSCWSACRALEVSAATCRWSSRS